MSRLNELGNMDIVYGSQSVTSDFAATIAFLAHTREDIQMLTENSSRVAKTVGLKINAGKSKIKRIKKA